MRTSLFKKMKGVTLWLQCIRIRFASVFTSVRGGYNAPFFASVFTDRFYVRRGVVTIQWAGFIGGGKVQNVGRPR